MGDPNPTCDHPERTKDPRTGKSYCFPCACEAARERCIAKSEGWRWGVGNKE